MELGTCTQGVYLMCKVSVDIDVVFLCFFVHENQIVICNINKKKYYYHEVYYKNRHLFHNVNI